MGIIGEESKIDIGHISNFMLISLNHLNLGKLSVDKMNCRD